MPSPRGLITRPSIASGKQPAERRDGGDNIAGSVDGPLGIVLVGETVAAWSPASKRLR